MRKERDELGERDLPDEALYGLQSLRAEENFSLDNRKTNRRLIYAIVKIKKAAALSYRKIAADPKHDNDSESGPGSSGGKPDKAEICGAIVAACDKILAGETEDAFIVDALQGGAGTSTNMNVNEVIANLALKILGKPAGSYDIIHPLDDVNRLQSTNDVYPTGLRIAAIELLRELSEGCAKLQEALQKRENEFEDVKKLGRTELQDAVPISLGAEFGAYAQAIGRDRWRLYKVEERLRQVNLGGAAVGFSNKQTTRWRFEVLEELRSLTGMGLAAAEYPMDLTQNNDVFVEVSGLLKSLGVNLTKIANDLRLMSSGPHGGLGEIKLAPMQKGSTIMPGKVNPVIPEMIIQVGIRVAANDFAITAAAARGELELNAFSPLIADALLESLSLLNRGVYLFRTKCVETLTANRERCAELLAASYAFAASHIGRLGYDRVAGIVAENQGDPERIRRALEDEGGTDNR
ncbi:aspartate ammonia-lyase [Spirochaetia bacterium]|nr:aspartate ammonia-lyase [Spirochaetia bacterium]